MQVVPQVVDSSSADLTPHVVIQSPVGPALSVSPGMPLNHYSASPLAASTASHSSVVTHLDQYISRAVLDIVLDRFFTYVWCLNPIVDRDRLTKQLTAYYNAHAVVEQEWLDIVLALIAATIMQLPRDLQPVPAREGRRLVDRIRHELLARLRAPYDYHDIGVEKGEWSPLLP